MSASLSNSGIRFLLILRIYSISIIGSSINDKILEGDCGVCGDWISTEVSMIRL
jgi:hypothetical protein